MTLVSDLLVQNCVLLSGDLVTVKVCVLLQLFNQVFYIKCIKPHVDFIQIWVIWNAECKQGRWDSLFWQRHSLGHQGESFSAHCRTRHQLDHHVFAGGLKMHPCHLLQHWRQGGHITSLCAGVSACCVQNVSPVHDQQQHMRLTFPLRKGWKKTDTLKGRGSKGGKE